MILHCCLGESFCLLSKTVLKDGYFHNPRNRRVSVQCYQEKESVKSALPTSVTLKGKLSSFKSSDY